MSRRFLRLAKMALCTAALALCAPRGARAESIIKHPGDHPRYSFEAEPHLAIDPYGADGFGPGFRGTLVLVDNGFVSSINNSVGLGFGLDWLFYGDRCDGSRGRVRPCDNGTDFMLPVVMQWNFWLHPQWSVFGEPGVAMHLRSGTNDDFDFDFFTFYAGGRFHFNDSVALTLRLGAPLVHDNVISIGASFLL